MTTFFGIACLVLGVLWIAFPALASLTSTIKLPNVSSNRNDLFNAYLLLHDHLEKVGTPEQKKALEVVLGAIVVQAPEGK